MDSWKKFNQTSSPDKEAFYSSLNMKNITDVNHRHAKRAFKNLNNKEKVCLKKTGVELELITNFDMLLMIDKGIRGGICHAIYRYIQANNKNMTYYDKNKEI